MTAMQRWQEEHARIGDVRGLGAMVAMELCEPDGSPAPAFTLALQAACSRRHLLTIRAGMYDNVVRLHFPLTIDDETFTRGLRLLEEALVETVHAHRTDSA